MGNQSTSGIVEEANEGREKPREISSPDVMKEENQTQQVQEDETGDFQEKSEGEETVNEDCETQTEDDPNESNLEEGRSMFKNEEHDEVSCDARGEMQNSNQECTQTITILNSKPHEDAATDITSEYQEDQSILEKEIVEIDCHDVETKENDLVTPCDESAASETGPDETEESGENEERLEEEQCDSFSTLNDVQSISLTESCADENVDQIQLPDQEISQFLISCNDDPLNMIESDDVMENGEECAAEIDSHSGLEKVDEVKTADESGEKAVEEVKEMGGSSAVRNGQENEELAGETILEKVVLRECVQNEHEESRENLGFESKISIVELKKCPSFDFGVSFDKQTAESDQTPLLFQDKTARRSVSSCSNLRIETKYLAKHEGLEVEEKTIRMERSNSESFNKQETALKASPSYKNDDSLVSERANAKRKPRSSLFTTCICCTAAIS